MAKPKTTATTAKQDASQKTVLLTVHEEIVAKLKRRAAVAEMHHTKMMQVNNNLHSTVKQLTTVITQLGKLEINRSADERERDRDRAEFMLSKRAAEEGFPHHADEIPF